LSHVDEILLDNKAEETSMVPEACSKQHLPILDYSSTCTCQRWHRTCMSSDVRHHVCYLRQTTDPHTFQSSQADWNNRIGTFWHIWITLTNMHCAIKRHFVSCCFCFSTTHSHQQSDQSDWL